MPKPTSISLTRQRYVAYSYDILALLTSILAVTFVFYAIFHNHPSNQTIVIVLLGINAVCMWASYQFKNKLKLPNNTPA